jgi:hypothetical protein
MTLNENSINAQVYRWFYNKCSMPTNLCPYFWKSVWMWMAMLPYSVITLPANISIKFDKRDHGERIAIGIVLYLALVAAISILLGISSFFIEYVDRSFLWHAADCGRLLLFLFSGAALFAFTIERLRYWKKNRRNKKLAAGESVQTDNIIVGFIKAKYNKYCPQITWKK